MAITPKEAGKLGREEKSAISRLEAEIDETIKKSFQDSSGRAVYSIPWDSEGRKVGLRTISKIVEMYNKAGWNVEYHSDQREGEWLEFTPRARYPHYWER